MGEKEEIYSNIQFAKDLWHFARKHRFMFFSSSLLLIFTYALGLLPPIITAKIVDFFTHYSGGSLKLFYNYLLILLALTAFLAAPRLIAKHYLGILTSKMQREAKVESFQKIMQAELMWHDTEGTGNKMEKISSGVKAIGDFMDFYINQGTAIFVSFGGIIAVFAILNIKYSLIAILLIISYLFAEFSFNKKIAQKTILVSKEKEKSSGKAYEFSSNISTVKSLGIENALNKQIVAQEKRVLRAIDSKRLISTYKWILIQAIASSFFVLFIFLVGRDIIGGALTIGSIVIYITYVDRLNNNLNVISNVSGKLVDTKYGFFRMMQIHRAIPSLNEEGAINLKSWSQISLKDISFKYREEEVLDNFNFSFKKGQKIGIVGRSGSGKSTLFKLLLKLYLPKEGMIYFDNVPVTGIKRDSILEKISIVPQETELFNLSFKDNIIISNPGKVDYAKYSKAIRISQCVPVIAKLKNKDLTLIGEKGVRLSGGERQRLGIARAIYKDSEIIIFDEATSNLDYETEKNILESMEKELKDKTLIISAHRLSTLRGVENIIIIDKGKIVEQGKYEELLRKRGQFYRLWRQQEAWRD